MSSRPHVPHVVHKQLIDDEHAWCFGGLAKNIGILLLFFLAWSTAGASTVKDAVEAKLKELHAVGYTIEDVNDPTVKRLFANFPLVVVRFRQYPIGVPTPTGFKSSNIVYAEGGGWLFS